MGNVKLAPILKWVGGKKQIFPEIQKRLPKKFNKYFEPFVGGGYVFLQLKPKVGYINDFNEELINLYRIVKEEPKELIKKIQKHKERNSKEYFYKIRSYDRKPNFNKISKVDKAARMVFLNKTCFNGLYRVNSNGELNSPYGKYKSPQIFSESNINNISDYFNQNNISIVNGDYKELLQYIEKGDFVYLDPPYDPVSKTSSFTGYSADGFNKQNQIELKEFCDLINKKGAYFLLSNSSTDFIKELYANYYVDIIKVKRILAAKNSSRCVVEEVLVRNYEK